MTTLLIVIFIGFIAVGLPDSVLGTAWPQIYRDLDLPLSLQGYISFTVSIGTIASSLMSATLIKKLGPGKITAISTLLTVIALFGFSFTRNPVFFFIFAIPLGLGAGSVDTALNNFVANHYTASQMSFLHCFYGIGVALSPFVMSIFLGDNGNWRRGYLFVALIQAVIAVVSFSALPLWKKAEALDKETEADGDGKNVGFKDALKSSAAWLSGFAFLSICAVELTAGQWSSSYFVNTKGLSSDRSALITMLFYIGLSVGRFLSGLFAGKLGRRRILWISFFILPIALLIYVLSPMIWLSAVALFLLGMGIGPVYPNLVHITPSFFGKELSRYVMSIQQALTYFGVMLAPWLFGIIAQNYTTALLPYYLIIMFSFYVLSFIPFMRSINRKRQ